MKTDIYRRKVLFILVRQSEIDILRRHTLIILPISDKNPINPKIAIKHQYISECPSIGSVVNSRQNKSMHPFVSKKPFSISALFCSFGVNVFPIIGTIQACRKAVFYTFFLFFCQFFRDFYYFHVFSNNSRNIFYL